MERIEISDWKNPGLTKSQRVVSLELYPKKEFNLILANLNHKIVKDVLLMEAVNPHVKQKSISSSLKKMKECMEPWEFDDNYLTFKAEYQSPALKRGRVFPLDGKGYCAMSRVLRSTFGGELYQDVDIVNAHPILLEQFIEKAGLTHNSSLSYYNSNREKFLSSVMEETGMDRDDAKVSLLVPVNGGFLKCGKSKLLKEWVKNIQVTVDEIYELCSTAKDYKKYFSNKITNPKGCTINNILCDLECKALQAAVEYCYSSTNVEPSVLCFDGFMVQHEYDEEEGFFYPVDLNQEFLDELNEAVEFKTGYKVNFVVKPFSKPISTKDLSFDVKENFPTIKDFCSKFNDLNGHNTKVFDEDLIWCFNLTSRIWFQTKSAGLGHYMVDFFVEHFNSTINDLDELELYKKFFGAGGTYITLGKYYSSNQAFRSDPNDFSPNCYLVPVGTDCVDIRDLSVREIQPSDNFTFTIPRKYKAYETWNACENFFKPYFEYEGEDGLVKDIETFNSFKLALGASLTGIMCKWVFILTGDSNSGKSSIFNILTKVLGTGMSRPVNKSLFVSVKESGIDTHIQKLESGFRIGLCDELSDKYPLNDDTLKKLTGGSAISIRPFKGIERDITCQTKFFISTNTGKIPKFDVSDTGLESRMILFPFKNKFKRKTGLIDEWVTKHGSRCLSWLIQQAHNFYKAGEDFPKTPAMKSIKKELFTESNPVFNFFEKFEEEEDVSKWIPSWRLYELFKEMNYHSELTQMQFTKYASSLFTRKVAVDRKIEGRRTKSLFKYSLRKEFEEVNQFPEEDPDSMLHF